jgi:hypothetical protein
MGSSPGNAWQKGRPDENSRNQSRAATPAAPGTPTMNEEPHVPLNGYNADDVKAWMKKRKWGFDGVHRALDAMAGEMQQAHHLAGYEADTTLPDGSKIPVYKPQMPGGSNTPKAPWGKRPNQMADGRDFWVEFRKQVNGLEGSTK